jgi:hypothetical protein
VHLSSVNDKVRLTTSAAITVDVHASYVDFDPSQPAASQITPDRKNTPITTATTTDIVLAPASGVFRKVKFINIRNRHATSSVDITVIHTDGTNAIEIDKVTLGAGGRWTYGSEPDV